MSLQSRGGRTALYWFLNGAGETLYVGITSNLAVRMYEHGRKPWWPEVTCIGRSWHETREQAWDEETRMIAALQPKYNVGKTPRMGMAVSGGHASRTESERSGSQPDETPGLPPGWYLPMSGGPRRYY